MGLRHGCCAPAAARSCCPESQVLRLSGYCEQDSPLKPVRLSGELRGDSEQGHCEPLQNTLTCLNFPAGPTLGFEFPLWVPL